MGNKKVIVEKLKHPRHTTTVVGHKKAIHIIDTSFNKNILNHSWVISGSKSIGKATLAYQTAYKILKSEASNDNCLSKIIANSHPDLLVVEPSEESKSGEITVDDIRRINEFMHLTPVESKNRVVIIDPAEKMNTNAANALLKTLEEPPKNTYIFLISHRPSLLLPTIMSRCNQLALPDLNYDEAYEVCKKNLEIDDKTLNIYLRFAQNLPGLVIDLYNNDAIGFYKELLEHISHYPDQDILTLNKLSDTISKNDNAKWGTFTYCYGLILQKLIKTSCQRSCHELFDGELALIKKIVNRTKLEDLFFVAESADTILRTTESANLDKKQVVFVVLEVLKSAIK